MTDRRTVTGKEAHEEAMAEYRRQREAGVLVERETEEKDVSDRPLELRIQNPRDVLAEAVDIRGLVDDEHRVLAAAALVIREGLDNLAAAMRGQREDDEG